MNDSTAIPAEGDQIPVLFPERNHLPDPVWLPRPLTEAESRKMQELMWAAQYDYLVSIGILL